MTETLSVDTIRAGLVATAEAKMAPYPQYAGHFDRYVVAQAKRARRSRGVEVYAKHEFVLLDPDSIRTLGAGDTFSPSLVGKKVVTVWLPRNLGGCDTSRRLDDFVVVTP